MQIPMGMTFRLNTEEKVQEEQMHQASSSWAGAVGGSDLPSMTGLCPHAAPCEH